MTVATSDKEPDGRLEFNEYSDRIRRIEEPLHVEKYMLNISSGIPNHGMAEMRAKNEWNHQSGKCVYTSS